MSKHLRRLHKKRLASQSPAREDFLVFTLLYRLLIVSAVATAALMIIVAATLLACAPESTRISFSAQPDNQIKVLGAQTTNDSSDESIVHRIVRSVFRPLGKFSQWLISLADEDTQVVNPLTTKDINQIFELDEKGNVIVKKQLILLEQPLTEATPSTWNEIKGKPSLLSSINEIEGYAGNIELAQGSNIEITNNKEENTITIASTGSVQVIGDSGSSATVNISAGTGISISGTSPDFTIANTNLGSSQNIFKNVAVSGQSTIVADSNNDALTFAAGSGITLTTSATNDRLTIASTGGSTPFSNVTTGTNTNALVVGTGGSLTVSGSGSITATNLV
ncbi:MAG TPA: hypothetical protein VF303_01510, partial [Candidatus Nanoarchaeia archaeon]